MHWGKIRHVPVVDEDEHVVGMVTQRDLLRYVISPTSLRKTRVGCLPVVEDGILVGIVAEFDLLELVENAASVARP